MTDVTWLERVFLGVLTLLGTIFGVRSTLRAKQIEARLTYAAAQLQAQAKHEDVTGTHLLEAWKLERSIAESERAELRREREASQHEREAARLAREAEHHARQASRLDNEIAERAMQDNHKCQKQLALVLGRLESGEHDRKKLNDEIAKLKTDVELLQYNKSIPPPNEEA